MSEQPTLLVLDRVGGHSAALVSLLEALGRSVHSLHPRSPEETYSLLPRAIVFMLEEVLEVWTQTQVQQFLDRMREYSAAVVILCHLENIEILDPRVRDLCDIMPLPLHPSLLRAKLSHLDSIYASAYQSFVASEATSTAEQCLEQSAQDKEIAIHLYKDKIERTLSKLDSLVVYQHEDALLEGEIILADRNPIGDLHVLVSKFSVKGLPAVIGGLSLCDIFYSMVNKSFSSGIILAEINKKLRLLLPDGLTVRAAYLCQLQRGGLLYWNGGLEPLALLRPHQPPFWMPSSHLPLAHLPEDEFLPQMKIVEFSTGDRVLLSMAPIEINRVEHLSTQSAVGAHKLLGALVQSHPVTSLCLLGESTQPALIESEALFQGLSQDWSMSMVLGPHSLKSFDPLPFLSNLIIEVPQLNLHRTSLHTILTELYSNGLEHGLLQLDSSMKEHSSGIEHYYNERQRRLKALETGSIRVKMTLMPKIDGGEIYLEVEDSGPGFDVQSLQDRVKAQGAYSGRGLALVFGLCHRVDYSPKGNLVKVQYRW